MASYSLCCSTEKAMLLSFRELAARRIFAEKRRNRSTGAALRHGLVESGATAFPLLDPAALTTNPTWHIHYSVASTFSPGQARMRIVIPAQSCLRTSYV